MMKRMIRAVAAIAMLIWTCPPAQAQFTGQLRRDFEWRLAVDNSPAAGPTALTIHYLNSRRGDNEISDEEIEIRTVPGGSRIQYTLSRLGRDVRRIIVDVDSPDSFVEIDVEISQIASSGNASFSERVEGQGHLVVDVVD